MKITVGIPTKNRQQSLAMCLSSIIMQTLTPYEIIVIDDSDPVVELRDIPTFQYLMMLMERKGIKFRYEYGQKMGTHISHARIQELADTEWIFRIDDDEIAEPDCLDKLSEVVEKYDMSYGRNPLGAVGPLVLSPNASKDPTKITNTINDIYKPASQWFRQIRSVTKQHEHLHSSFLYKKGLAKQVLSLSPVSHREETLFSHAIFKTRHELLVADEAVVWHFQSPTGGIRSYNDAGMYAHDEGIFEAMLAMTGHKAEDQTQYIVLDNGIGDHYAFKNILPEIRAKYKKFILAVCFEDVFWDEEGLELISIAEAKKRLKNIDKYNIYGFMWHHNWKTSIVDAYKKMYL